MDQTTYELSAERRYSDGLERDELVETMAYELMSPGNECDPWTEEAVLEALNDVSLKDITRLLRDAAKHGSKDFIALPLCSELIRCIDGYWQEMAEATAEQMLREQAAQQRQWEDE